FLDDDEYRCLFRCADWFVMPSICELQSITTLEAMASGLPVVGANRYALPELIHPGVNGALFEPGNDQALASQVMAMLSSDRLQAMGQESLRLVAAHSLDRAISDYESIYHQLTQR
ncbi:glycosyltransferase, partial [bacterium]|nr:glycosyltransferase [bacterium]